MPGLLLSIIIVAPGLAALACFLTRSAGVAEKVNLAAGIVTFVAAIPFVILSAGGPYHYWSDYLLIDMLGAWVVLCTAIVYLLASIYAVGYMRLLEGEQDAGGARKAEKCNDPAGVQRAVPTEPHPA